MVYVFDIDGTICHTQGSSYELSMPMQNRIDYINKLYDSGNTIYCLPIVTGKHKPFILSMPQNL